jgi:hypothetical protein
MAVAALVAVIGLAFALAGPRIGDPPAPATPSPAVWTGPVRADAAAMPEIVMFSGLAGPESTWTDQPDATLGWTDIVRVSYGFPDQPHWYLDLDASPPEAATLDPEQRVIEYGLVFDVDEDGVADYWAAINNDAPQPGDYRVWVTDLDTGDKREQVAGPYGFPIEFSHPDGSGRNQMLFTFLSGSTPYGVRSDAMRFYAYASTTDNGQVVAWDYAPDFGWLASGAD